MPSHAMPAGPDRRARRQATRRQRLRTQWQLVPMFVLVITSLRVAVAPQSPHASVASRVLGVLSSGLLGGLVVALIVVLAVILRGRLTALRMSRAGPRPRWQYLLAALAWLGITWGLVLASRWAGPGLAGRAAAVLGIWSGAYCLVNIGRAALRGIARDLMWWWDP
jgi:hypothetical protein